jgi:hypothetical protein
MKYTFLIVIIMFLLGCKTKNGIDNNTTKKVKDPNAKYTTCVLVEKSFVNKGGKMSDFKELYLQCSIQDYFIKICAGEVTAKELRKHLNQGITVDMEIKDGMWDHCSSDLSYAQSRMGTYVVIHKIIE